MRIAFGPFTFDSETRQLLGNGQPVHLSPKAFDLLALLLERRPAVVAKSEIQSRVWPGTFVEDANLSVLVADIRRALDDDPRRPRFIRTVHGRGYAFAGAAEDLTTPEPARGRAERAARWWLVWRAHTRPLVPGENVVGRDPACEVWLDARGVSRRHARISVGSDEVLLEDLGSTNGTFVGGRKIASAHRLREGDEIAVGPETLIFRIWRDGGTPPTERVRRRK